MSEHSKRPDQILRQPRTAILFEKNHDGSVPKTALRDLTVGHQYYRQHLERPKGINYQRLRPGAFTMMCEREDVKLGKVTTVHALRAEDCAYPATPLQELVKERLMVRDDPSKITSLASYMKLRKSIWLVEETEDGQFRCNCPLGIKGKVCKHELGLNYKFERIEVLPHAAALPLGNRRTKGRPKKVTMEKPKEDTFSALSGREAEIVLDGQEMLDAGVQLGGEALVDLLGAAAVGQEVEQERQAGQEVEQERQEPVQERQEVVQETGLEEAEAILKGLQKVLKGKQVTCAFCGTTVSFKSIKRHEKSQSCQQARSPPSAPPSSAPPSSSAPSCTNSMKRKVAEGTVGRRTRTRGQ